MVVFRVEKNEDFTVMSNYHFKDKNLSMRAKGLLSMMLSLPDEWDYSLNGLTAMSKEGITAIRAMVQELADNGYLSRRRLRNEQGQLTVIEYTIYEQPQENKPLSDKPTPKNPASDFPTQANRAQ